MLRVEGLERIAGAFRLCVDDWHVAPGSYVVILGPSGAGKTMLLETIAGLHPLRCGHIHLDGRDVTRLPPERRGIALVYQHCWLFPHLSVRQNIDFGRRYHGQGGRVQRLFGDRSPADTERLAEMLGITHLLDRRPDGLSGGERQRVALARALAIRPRLLFLDEPLGTLDPVTREHVATELLRCHRTFGMTTIHVTHDHTEARMVGDSVAVLLGGRLEQAGGVEAVFHRPRTPPLARFLGCENLVQAVAEPSGRRSVVVVRWADAAIEVNSDCAGAVVVCLRPEDVHFDDTDAMRTDRHRADVPIVVLGHGIILEAAARGAQVRVIVEAGPVRWVSLVGASEWRRQARSVGSRVTVQASADAVHLVPSEAGACA